MDKLILLTLLTLAACNHSNLTVDTPAGPKDSVSCETINSVAGAGGADGNCTGHTISTGANSYNCTVLIISAGTYNIPGTPGGQHLDITVSGDVCIDKDAIIVISGSDGVSDTTENQPGGTGGPGASDGGGNVAGPQDAMDAPNGGTQGLSDAIICGAGGGGGGFATTASNGADCTASTGGAGGTFYDINVMFRGGFGGGAGGLGSFGSPLSTATGGGGGGAILIVAQGNIVNFGTIKANGGNGGSAPANSNAGGGGGGSGGAIKMVAGSKLVNEGIFELNGGIGGDGDGLGSRGGNGSAGILILEDQDGVIEGRGTGGNGHNPF